MDQSTAESTNDSKISIKSEIEEACNSLGTKLQLENKQNGILNLLLNEEPEKKRKWFLHVAGSKGSFQPSIWSSDELTQTTLTSDLLNNNCVDEWPQLTLEELLNRPVSHCPYYMPPLLSLPPPPPQPQPKPFFSSKNSYSLFYHDQVRRNVTVLEAKEKYDKYPPLFSYSNYFPSNSPVSIYKGLQENVEKAIQRENKQEVNVPLKKYPLNESSTIPLSSLPIGHLPVSKVTEVSFKENVSESWDQNIEDELLKLMDDDDDDDFD